MKHFVIALVVGAFATACSYRSETVVQKPTPVPATATVVATTDAPPPSTTVIVPAR
jgi:hypothetical protein